MTPDNSIAKSPEQQQVQKEAGDKKVNLVVQDLHLINIDRTVKDIRNWRNALINAESIYFPNRTRLYDLYEDVKLDGHLTGIINKRIDTVLNKSLEFYKDDKEVEELEDLLHSGVFRELKKNILQTIFHGITGMEFIPGKEFEFEEIPRKHIKPEFGVISKEQSNYEGLPYKDLSNIWVIGKRRDYGLLLQCSPYALYKKGGFADWSQYVEIFGQPIRVAKYDANDIKTKEQLTKTLTESGGSLAMIIPKQAEFEILDGKISNGDGQLQERLKDACNNEMSVIVLGNTETTSNSNGGSNAKSKEHAKQQDEIIKSDMNYLLTHLNCPHFFNILKSYGLPVDGGRFVFKKEIDITALSEKIKIDMEVAKQVPIADDYFYETYSIPKPQNYDELKQQQQEQQQAQQKAVLQTQQQPDNKPADKKKDIEKKKLKAYEKAMAWLADFFDQAHKD